MKKMMLVLFLATIVFVGCKKQEAPVTEAPAETVAPAAAAPAAKAVKAAPAAPAKK
jgi:hypothetical protein